MSDVMWANLIQAFERLSSELSREKKEFRKQVSRMAGEIQELKHQVRVTQKSCSGCRHGTVGGDTGAWCHLHDLAVVGFMACPHWVKRN